MRRVMRGSSSRGLRGGFEVLLKTRHHHRMIISLSGADYDNESRD